MSYREGSPPNGATPPRWSDETVERLLASGELLLPMDTSPARLAQLVEHPAFARVTAIRTSQHIAPASSIDALQPALRGLALRVLDLRHLELGDAGIVRVLENLSEAPLASLHLAGHFLRAPFTDVALEAIARRAPRVHELGLHRPRPSAGGLATFVATPYVDGLTSLTIDLGRFGTTAPPYGEWVRALAEREAPSALHALTLRDCRLLDYEVEPIARATRFSALRSLDLTGSLMTNAGVATLAESASLAALEELTLHGASLDDSVVGVLTRRSGLPALRRLGIAGTIPEPDMGPTMNAVGELDLRVWSKDVRAMFVAAGSPLEIY